MDDGQVKLDETVAAADEAAATSEEIGKRVFSALIGSCRNSKPDYSDDELRRVHALQMVLEKTSEDSIDAAATVDAARAFADFISSADQEQDEAETADA